MPFLSFPWELWAVGGEIGRGEEGKSDFCDIISCVKHHGQQELLSKTCNN